MAKRNLLGKHKKQVQFQPGTGSPKSPESTPAQEAVDVAKTTQQVIQAAVAQAEYNPNLPIGVQQEIINDFGVGDGGQPEVPELPTPAFVNLEEEILRGSAEDQLIGREEDEPKFRTPMEVKLDAQTEALLAMARNLGILVENQQRTKQLSLLEITPTTPWNPEGKRNRVPLTRPAYQHGQLINPLNMTEEEISLVNQIKPGRYYDRKIEVYRTVDGGINFTYMLGNTANKIEFWSKFPSLVSLLTYIIDERKAKEAKRRANVVEEDEFLG